ncbi:MAG: hypothetical protein ACRCSL_16620 [Microbacterium sp.]
MDTTTHEILYSRERNENYTTPLYPLCVWREGLVDLERTATYCRSSDDDGPIVGKVYEVRRVTLPSWLAPEDWIANMVGWKYLWAAIPATAPERVQRALLPLGFTEQYLLGQLLGARPRSSEGFLASLREQVWQWILSEERTHRSPLSPRQWQALNRRPWEAKRASERLYWDRSYVGVPA